MLIVLFFTTNILFFVTWRKEPGYLKPIPGLNFVSLVEKVKDVEHLCPTCQVIRTPTSKHCYVCNKCIDHYDHHCIWLNNCVGRKNHNVFFLFILSLESYMILIILTGFCSKSSYRPLHLPLFRLYTWYESIEPGKEGQDLGLVPLEYLYDIGGCVQSSDDLRDDNCGALFDFGD